MYDADLQGYFDEKTKVLDLRQERERLDFLGYSFRYDRDRLGRAKRYLNLFPSKVALARARERLRQRIGPRQCHVPIRELIDSVNRYLMGWSGYFSLGYPRMAYREVNRYVRERLTQHLRRRSQRGFKLPKGMTYYAFLQQEGLIYL